LAGPAPRKQVGTGAAAIKQGGGIQGYAGESFVTGDVMLSVGVAVNGSVSRSAHRAWHRFPPR
jgi:hypothetical protein